MAQQGAAPVHAEDLLAVRTFAGGQPLAVSPTGRWIAYVITDQADDWNVQEPRPTGHVFVQALGGAPAPPRALTTGAVHSAFPVWSPDGRRLAFVREEQNQGREIIWDAERDQMTPVGDAVHRPDVSGAAVGCDREDADRGGQPSRRRRRRRIASIGQEHRRAHSRRSVLHRRAQGVAGGDRRGERQRRPALAASPIVLRSFRLSPSGRISCSTWRPIQRRSASSARNRTTRSSCRSIWRPARSRLPRESWRIADATRGRLTGNSSSSRKAAALS